MFLVKLVLTILISMMFQFYRWRENPILFETFLDYSKQDSKALFEAMQTAQDLYFQNHKVDITSVYSTSTLSLKIFRTSYLKTDIPIMKRSEDTFVRRSYFGGATDYYKGYGENLHYYDVNSLYPFAMLKPMPLELKKVHVNMNGWSIVDFESFFGFVECNVETPDNIKIPILPFKHRGKTIFPIGKWRATYFSEEIKAAIKLGYKIETTAARLKGYEYSKYDLFNGYINHFYDIKKNSVGRRACERFIAKMHLNQLYGYFGRKLDLLETVNIDIKDYHFYASTRIIKAPLAREMEIDENTLSLLLYSNLNEELISKINSAITLDGVKISNPHSFVKSNVGIASAVTAYARIHMIPFARSGKLDNDVYYSDTDYVFVGNKLDDKLIGRDIGLMKVELHGLLIDKAYFLGVKQYGYSYHDTSGQVNEKSVFAGVTRDSLTYRCATEIERIYNGETLFKETAERFFKSLKFYRAPPA